MRLLCLDPDTLNLYLTVWSLCKDHRSACDYQRCFGYLTQTHCAVPNM